MAHEHGAPYVSSIRDFLFPRHDERVEAELGRSYRIAFCVLVGILFVHIVLNMFLVMWEMQFTEPGDPMPVSGGVVSWVEYLALMVALILITVIQIRKGVYITGRWCTPDGNFPIAYACAIAAFSGALVGVTAMLTRVYVEVRYVGWEHVTWAGDVAIMAIDAIMIFGAVMLALYASFRAAQKREAKLLEELDPTPKQDFAGLEASFAALVIKGPAALNPAQRSMERNRGPRLHQFAQPEA